MASDAEFSSSLRQILGARLVLGSDVEARHMGDWAMRAPSGDAPFGVAYPRSTAEVSAVLDLCNTHRRGVVPQGGLTGLAGGATPVKGCLVLSLERMRAIDDIDPVAGTITVEAGVPLQTIQETAEAAGLFYGVDLGARGSCLAGGSVATNAGGNRVLRFGMTRDQVLGIEAVLADGTVVTSLNKMLKNNAGFDLKQLFIGSEGLLGIITRVVLRLRPQPVSQCVSLVALADFACVLDLLRHVRERLGDRLSAFEFMSPEFYQLATVELDRRPPIAGAHGAYALIETMGGDQVTDEARLAEAIEEALGAGTAQDAVLARSQQENLDLWRLRDLPGEFPKTSFWPSVAFDISIPTADIGRFMPDCRARVLQRWPTARTIFFGHIADSNLHVSVRVDEDPQPIHALDEVIYGCVRDWHGSISAEHGIGLVKRDFLGYSRTKEEIGLMRLLKASLDPKGILNPGKVL